MDETREPDDEFLVGQAQAGDMTAFDCLVLRYAPRLFGLVYHMTANREDTNDLLQEIFARAHRSIRGFRGRSSFYTWIHSIAVNMTINFLKRRGRRQQISLEEIDPSIRHDREFRELTELNTPIREADLSDLQRELNEAMMRLSEDHRVVVTLFDIQGLPHKEISEILGISEGTVRSRLFYAHRQLQNSLAQFRNRR